MINYEYRDNIIQKLKNNEPLNKKQLEHIESLLTLDTLYDKLLDNLLGVDNDTDNIFNLKEKIER